MEILTKETWSGQNLLPLQFPGLHSLGKENQVSFLRTFLSETRFRQLKDPDLQ